jgi:hypothetical protein
MVTTVTISTITIIAASSIVIGIGIFATLLLVGFLSTREVLNAGGGVKQKLLARSLLIGIIPLLIGFMVIVALKIAEILA